LKAYPLPEACAAFIGGQNIDDDSALGRETSVEEFPQGEASQSLIPVFALD